MDKIFMHFSLKPFPYRWLIRLRLRSSVLDSAFFCGRNYLGCVLPSKANILMIRESLNAAFCHDSLLPDLLPDKITPDTDINFLLPNEFAIHLCRISLPCFFFLAKRISIRRFLCWVFHLAPCQFQKCIIEEKIILFVSKFMILIKFDFQIWFFS